jgi:multicomponent Na+:H+ antiporter subunit G
MLQSGLTLVSAKLLMLGVLIFIAGPTATHAIAHAAMLRGLKPILSSDRSEKNSS